MSEYLPRLADRLIQELFREVPALLLVGPRAGGKTTTASRYAATVIRLDRPAEAAAFAADPDAALRGFEEPVLLDEWQAVPEVLGAVKRAVDSDPRPGRFLLTGSVRADLDAETWPGTGRLVRVPMMGMTVAERQGRGARESFLDRLVRGGELPVPDTPLDLVHYLELALESGYPEPALRLSPRNRQRWLESYVEQLVTRDAQVEGPRDPDRLRRFFEAYALYSARVVDDKALHDAAGLNRRTGLAYERLLVNLYVVEAMPAWTHSRLRRLSSAPKRYLVDPALMAGLLRLDVAAILRDGDLLEGILDSLVAAELRAGLPMAECRPRLYHLRQQQGRQEVDLVAEVSANAVVGFEVKASASPRRDDARHLVWLRERLGDRFLRGVVFHTGPRVFQLEERIQAVPISALWA